MFTLSAATDLVRGTGREIGMRRGNRQRTEEESKLLDYTCHNLVELVLLYITCDIFAYSAYTFMFMFMFSMVSSQFYGYYAHLVMLCRPSIWWDVAPRGFEHISPLQYKAMQG